MKEKERNCLGALYCLGIGIVIGALIQHNYDKGEIHVAQLAGHAEEISKNYPASAVSGDRFYYLSTGIATGKYEGHCINADGAFVGPGVYQGTVDGKVASVKCDE